MIVEFRIIKKNEPQMIWAHSLNSPFTIKSIHYFTTAFKGKFFLEFPQNYPPQIYLPPFVIHNFQKMAKI